MSYTLIRRPATSKLPDGATVETLPNGKRVAHWVDADGKKRTAQMDCKRVIVGPGPWVMKYDDASGKRTQKVLGTTDRRVAEQYANKIATEARGVRLGLIDPRAERIRLEGARPVAEHLKEYKAVLTCRGNKPRYIRDTMTMLTRIIKDTKAMRLQDITEDRVVAAISKMGDDRRVELGVNGKTIPPVPISAARKNAHIVAAKGFTVWAVSDDRAHLDPLRNLAKSWNQDADRRLVRRELLPDELARLLDAAKTGPKHHGISGEDRAILYAIAVGSGLRRGELASLTAGSFTLDAAHPMVVVQAGHTKNGKEAMQPLGADLVKILRPFLATKKSGALLFKGLTQDTADMLRTDMRAARAAWVAEATGEERARRVADPDFLMATDSQGRKADFHGTRHTYISAVVASGASVKVAQTLARHSSPELTIRRYSHTRLHDLASAIPAIPMLLPALHVVAG